MTSALDALAALVSDTSRNELFRRLILRDVRVVKLAGEIIKESAIGQVRLEPANAGYRIEPGRVICRFEQEIALLDDAENDVATITVEVLVDFHTEGEEELVLAPEDEDSIRSVLLPGAFNVAYPFIREAVHTMSSKLDLGPVTLGVLVPGELRPQDVHVRGIAEFRDKQGL